METVKPEKPAHKTDADAVPVFELRFDTGYRDPDFTEWLDSVTGTRGVLRATQRISIVYLPSRQFYRIIEQPPRNAEPVVFYIPREWAMWRPLDGQKLA